MKKRILGLVLVLCMLFSLAVVPAHAASSGTCGANLTWTLDDSGTLTISGTGVMTNYSSSSSAPWYSSRSSIKTVVIENSVTRIGQYAFYNCSSLTTITIPDSVTSIGEYAFTGCSSLTSITIPDSVTSIGQYAFSRCSNLASITLPFVGGSLYTTDNFEYIFGSIPSSLTTVILTQATRILNRAFKGCSSLTTITIPDSVTSIGEYAFYNCSSLTTITIPDSVTNIGNNAFSGCNNIIEMTLPFIGQSRQASDAERTFGYIFGTSSYNGAYSVKQNYSASNSATFYLPRTLKKVTVTKEATIPYGAFNNCTNIYEIYIKEGPSAIENYAFSGCDLLKKVSVPSSVETIAQYAFSNSSNIIIYGNEAAYIAAFATRNKIPFVKTDGTGGEEGNVTLVTEDSVGDLTWKLYSNGLFELSGSGDMPTFRNNTKTPWYPYIDTVKKITISADTDITSYAFFGMDNLEYVNIIGNVTEIADDAFSSCANLSKIIIPSSVSVIGEYAFDDCPKLTIYCKSGSAAEAFATENGIATKVSGFDAVLNKIGNNVIVTANVPDDDITKNIHAALYSDNGAILDYMIYPAEYSNNTVHFMFRKMVDLSYIKVFLWNGFETMMPLDESIVLTVGE